MIEYKKGNLFNDYHPLIAHGTNSLGVMGSGFAKQVKELYPNVYKEYSKAFVDNKLELGYIQIIPAIDSENREFYIANCVTQKGYGLTIQHVNYDAVRECMSGLNAHMKWATKLRAGFWTHIAMPKIGAGLGGGDWNIIETIINEEIPDFKIVVYVL